MIVHYDISNNPSYREPLLRSRRGKELKEALNIVRSLLSSSDLFHRFECAYNY